MKTLVVAVLATVLIASITFAAAPDPQSQQAKEIKAMVDRAAALIDKKGKEAFPEFKKKNSEWYKGDTYLFVADMKGTTLVNAAFPDEDGKNRLDLKDADGKPFVRGIIAMLKKQDSGWIDYAWPKPGETKPSKKSAYVKKAKLGKETVYVGAGMYTN
ncbi:MAG TPA: cache domain-containing protein [Candidatus Binatia bacterium]|jgi:methyl-accepting chemotaxis protein